MTRGPVPSSFTPSITIPCKPVASPGHATVLAAVINTVFSIESWVAFCQNSIFMSLFMLFVSVPEKYYFVSN